MSVASLTPVPIDTVKSVAVPSAPAPALNAAVISTSVCASASFTLVGLTLSTIPVGAAGASPDAAVEIAPAWSSVAGSCARLMVLTPVTARTWNQCVPAASPVTVWEAFWLSVSTQDAEVSPPSVVAVRYSYSEIAVVVGSPLRTPISNGAVQVRSTSPALLPVAAVRFVGAPAAVSSSPKQPSAVSGSDARLPAAASSGVKRASAHSSPSTKLSCAVKMRPSSQLDIVCPAETVTWRETTLPKSPRCARAPETVPPKSSAIVPL